MRSPPITRNSVFMAMAALLALVAVGADAMQSRSERARGGDNSCRAEILRLCGPVDQAAMRQCLQENYAQLSEECQQDLRERIAQWEAREGPAPQLIAPDSQIAYGNEPRQTIDLYIPADGSDRRLPTVVFIHGGGWTMGDRRRVQQKPQWFHDQGYAFASIGYQLVPQVTVEEQMQDISKAIFALRANAKNFNLDPDQIIVIGHSAGAHLAALIATDPQYLGKDIAAIKGVILLDGAGYDLPEIMRSPPPEAQNFYVQAFGSDRERQKTLSPITHVAAPNAKNWLILYVEERRRSRMQSEALADALEASEAIVQLAAVPDTDHGELNRRLGTGQLIADDLISQFLERM
ncbi:alpha/beta hydrolase [Alterisphingorhabdus coralli]|uniref:Alpha/beta hydrolase n=1 Tax=Alterisphingorhabdus coralli TaxID=3071408 RepID=A0AA97F8I7_9SPHN|nr:alpha/beta hydrolase [Parasphingorhabdus sp. SCSIO 66989]WOE76121.1 alpha/beta hydrolase [Parasphingorhabdus sp. SCSIO 66989]